MTNTEFSSEHTALDAVDSLETITAVARSIDHDLYRVLMSEGRRVGVEPPDDGIGVPVDTWAALAAAESAIERVFYLIARDIERASA